MDYGIMSPAHIGLSGRMKLKVEMLGTNREEVTFAVDGRKIDVPCESLAHDSTKPDDLTLRFYPNQSIDRLTKQPIDEKIRTAIVSYIKKEFSEGDVKFEINMAG